MRCSLVQATCIFACVMCMWCVQCIACLYYCTIELWTVKLANQVIVIYLLQKSYKCTHKERKRKKLKVKHKVKTQTYLRHAQCVNNNIVVEIQTT